MAWEPPSPSRPAFYTIDDIVTMFGFADKRDFYRAVREGRFPRPRWCLRAWVYDADDLRAFQQLMGRWEPGPFDPEAKPGKKGKDADDDSGESAS